MEEHIVGEPISQHIFMFPFTINPLESSKDKLSFKEHYIKELEKDRKDWRHKDFSITEAHDYRNYNEYVYFYDCIREALFTRANEENPVSLYFEKELGENPQFSLLIKNGKTYTLDIDHISLRIFETNIGVLTIELLNHGYPEPRDVLIINDFGRRIYPQFLGEKREGVEPIDAAKKAFFPDKIKIACAGLNIEQAFVTEDFYREKPPVAEYIKILLGSYFEPPDSFKPIIDDRMYTLCWFGHNETINKLKSRVDEKDFDSAYVYEADEFWYKFIFVDGKDKGIANARMQRELVNNSTCARWVDGGTLFGVTRYSFMCLTDRSEFGCKIIRRHMERMYYQMAVLLLAQRASVIMFSNELSDISKEIQDIQRSTGKGIESIIKDAADLDARFIRFIDRLWFVEVTAQEQGIEMYDLAQKNMGLKEQIADLKDDISKLHSFVDLANERETTKHVNMLTSLGFLFLPLSLIVGIFGMDIYFMKIFYERGVSTSMATVGFAVTALVTFIFFAVFAVYVSQRLYEVVSRSERKKGNKVTDRIKLIIDVPWIKKMRCIPGWVMLILSAVLLCLLLYFGR